jgi:hypothetical protein
LVLLEFRRLLVKPDVQRDRLCFEADATFFFADVKRLGLFVFFSLLTKLSLPENKCPVSISTSSDGIENLNSQFMQLHHL